MSDIIANLTRTEKVGLAEAAQKAYDKAIVTAGEYAVVGLKMPDGVALGTTEWAEIARANQYEWWFLVKELFPRA